MTPTEDYCRRNTSLPDDSLYPIERSIALHTAMPHMASSPYQGALLQMLVSLTHPTIAVEVGTHAGYGAACIAKGMGSHGTLHLIEANDEFENLILRHADLASIRDRINLHIGLAADIIPTLPDGIEFVFIDADKENYDLYYSLLLPKMKPGSLLLLDNMLWYGRVVEYDNDPTHEGRQLRCERETRALHQLNHRITLDPRVDNILLPIRDGLMLCRLR